MENPLLEVEMTILTTLFAFNALADAQGSDPIENPAASQPNRNEAIIEYTPPIYWGTKAAVAVPANASEDVFTIGPSMGILLDNNNAMGMRVIYMDSPPDNPLAENTPTINMAWGPVVDWQYLFQPFSQLD